MPDFLDLAMLDQIPEQTILPDGSKVLFQVLKAEIGESGEDKKTAGQSYLKIMLKSTEETDSRPFTHVFMLPNKDLDRDTFNMRGRQLRDFFKCIDFDYAHGWNIFTETDELKGYEGACIVRVEDTPEYGEQNSVKKWL